MRINRTTQRSHFTFIRLIVQFSNKEKITKHFEEKLLYNIYSQNTQH